MHDLSIIVTLAGALAVALLFGWITQRIGLSTLVGYMVAGIVVGPHTPCFVADARLASQMAEIGVILLMFGVGMHFHPQELLKVWRIAVPGAVAQSVVAAVAGWAAARAFGWSHGAGLVFGMSLAVASTVVLMRMLVERDRLGSRDGHVAVGWLIVEDVFTVVALVVLPAVAAGATSAQAMAREVALALGAAGLFALLVWSLGTRLVAPIMARVAQLRSTELFTLTVFVVALGIALLASEVFHVSVALGAFFAGLVVGQSRFGPQAAADMAPFRDVFSALFFVSIGMLFNPGQLVEQPLVVLAALGIVLVVKPLVALLIVVAMRDTVRTALTVAVGLAQIGEFSFILAALGLQLKILPAEALDALVAAAILSIAVNPLLFRALPALERRFARNAPAIGAEPPAADSSGLPIAITSMGELGRRIALRFHEAGLPVFVVDKNVEALEALQERGIATAYGDPGQAEVLRAAGVADARIVVVTNATLMEKMRVCNAVKSVNPRASIIATADSAAERAWLREFGAAFVVDAMDEIGEALLLAVRRVL